MGVRMRPKFDCHKAAESKLFQWRWDLPTIAVDLKVIWGMSVTMGLEEDDSEGGYLEIYRFSDDPRFQKVTAPDHAVENVDPVMDQANTLIFMIDSPYALMAR